MPNWLRTADCFLLGFFGANYRTWESKVDYAKWARTRKKSSRQKPTKIHTVVKTHARHRSCRSANVATKGYLFGLRQVLMDTVSAKKKARADSQISSAAGLNFVMGELGKREFQVAPTLRNATKIDLFAHSPTTGLTYLVQVKALRYNNYFLISHDKIVREAIYVFVLLNKPGQAVRYFIVPGAVLIDEPERFGPGYANANAFPGILPRDLLAFENNWALFEQNRSQREDTKAPDAGLTSA